MCVLLYNITTPANKVVIGHLKEYLKYLKNGYAGRSFRGKNIFPFVFSIFPKELKHLSVHIISSEDEIH